MKKIIIGVNHSYPDSTGGCERVVYQIASGLQKKYNYECFILSNSCKFPQKYNGVYVAPCPMVADDFFNKINSFNADHFFIYSDVFHQWPFIVQNPEKINCKKSVALVGMNCMLSNQFLFNHFKRKCNEHFGVVVHSKNYQDYKICVGNSIPAVIIPNFVDMDEFIFTDKNNFREKYNIKENNIILCVSNFFPGKGQEFLVPIFNNIQKKGHDFIVVFISSTTQWAAIEQYKKMASRKINGSSFKSLFLNDISREDVVSAFKESDLFVFPSQKEVSPIVILEAMASRTPWVAMNVGNLEELSGGLLINNEKKDNNGFLRYDDSVYNMFVENIDTLLLDRGLGVKLGKEGLDMISSKYSLNSVLEKYDKFFQSLG